MSVFSSFSIGSAASTWRISSTIACMSGWPATLALAPPWMASSIGQPSTASAPRAKACSIWAIVRTPACRCGMLRVTPGGGWVPSRRRSSARSMIEYLKQGSTSRGSSASGRPLSSSVLPWPCSATIAAVLAASQAMKAGISTITLPAGCACISSCSSDSLATLSETLAPSAGHTPAMASSSCAASGAMSGRSGKTVSRVAETERFLSM